MAPDCERMDAFVDRDADIAALEERYDIDEDDSREE